jgi:hypothetical protein
MKHSCEYKSICSQALNVSSEYICAAVMLDFFHSTWLIGNDLDCILSFFLYVL